MYEITLNDKTLYHPNSDNFTVTQAKLYEELGNTGYMDITIPCTNPIYDEIVERNGKITLYKDDKPIWYGNVRDVSVNFKKDKNIYVVGELAELNDTVLPQHLYSNYSRSQLLSEFIDNHNSMVENSKQFTFGYIQKNQSKTISAVTDWEYTFDAINSHICEDDEYIRVRHENGSRYIDIVPIDNYGKRSEQYISFGDNLLNYTENKSTEDIATVCIPLGVTLEDGGIDDYENYLTCADANGGKVYVINQDAVSRLGMITKVVHFNVLNTPEALVTAANNWLRESQFAKMSIELSAIDLSMIEANTDSFELGDYVRVVCKPFGMDAWLPVRSKETDLLDLAKNSIKIGAEGMRSMTQQQNSIEAVAKSIPTREALSKTFLRNASNLINANGENGNLSIRIDKDGKPYEELIMDDVSLVESTRAWRWNLNGFGHGTKAKGDPEFNWEANVAMTMDGEIVAEKGSVAGFKIYVGEFIEGAPRDLLVHSIGDHLFRISASHDGLYGGPNIQMKEGNVTASISPGLIYTDGGIMAGQGIFAKAGMEVTGVARIGDPDKGNYIGISESGIFMYQNGTPTKYLTWNNF